MADDVFANTREITCQAGSSKSIAAFPDVCMTPPENPATPPGVPVPYPNFGMASDTTEGSKSVMALLSFVLALSLLPNLALACPAEASKIC